MDAAADRRPRRPRKLARSLRMPIYDVQIVGYPQRMRDHDARQRVLRDGAGAPPADPGERAGFSAMSASTAASVRTRTPVPPFAV